MSFSNALTLAMRARAHPRTAPRPRPGPAPRRGELARARCLCRYYLDENSAWGVDLAELRRALDAARASGTNPRALVVINPGNPTGASLPKEVVHAILAFAASEDLVLMADEVYQENVYGDAPPFFSFKRAYAELSERGAAGDAEAADLASRAQLVSFHSTSKGFLGECGLRGGYFELANFDPEVQGQLLKLVSIGLCSNTLGQLATGLMVKPPKAGDPSKAKWDSEREAILSSMKRRAVKLVDGLNSLEGVSCNAPQGAMYAFPQITLPPKAVAAADAAGKVPDTFYALALLEATGIVVVPGSGFGQKEGTWHFRTTFLPPENEMAAVVQRMATFHADFMSKYA